MLHSTFPHAETQVHSQFILHGGVLFKILIARLFLAVRDGQKPGLVIYRNKTCSHW